MGNADSSSSSLTTVVEEEGSQETDAFISPHPPHALVLSSSSSPTLSISKRPARKYDWILERLFGKPGPGKSRANPPPIQELFLGKPRDESLIPISTTTPQGVTATAAEPLDYASMEILMARLTEQKNAKRTKAHLFRMEARRLARDAKKNLANHTAAIGANLKRAKKLEEEANNSEIQYLTLDSQIELLGDVRLTGDTLKLFIHSTTLVENELRKFSQADVIKIMEELEDTAEKAQEQIEETAMEAPGQEPMHWKEVRDFMASVDTPEDKEREADDAEEDEKNTAFYATMNTLPAPPTPANTPANVSSPMAYHHPQSAGHRKAITVAEFEGRSDNDPEFESILF